MPPLYRTTGTIVRRRLPFSFSVRALNVSGFGPPLILLSILLLVYLSPSTLEMLGWDYFGGGSELAKIHPGTYLLVLSFAGTVVFNRRYWEVLSAKLSDDWGFLVFAAASVATTFYAVFVKHASFAPFVETFGVTLLVYAAVIPLSDKASTLFRHCVDVFMIVNIVIIFMEYMSGRNIVPVYVYSETGGAFTNYFGRPAAFFGHPLTASGTLCLYAIANIMRQMSRPMKNSLRAALAAVSLLAALLTGGRTAFVSADIVIFMLFVFSSGRALVSGVTRKEEMKTIFFWIMGGVFVVPLAYQFGAFDLLLGRFAYDNGSALARDYAWDILTHMPASQLWVGGPPDIIVVQQRNYGLIAIEVAWVNFVLVCGLIFTIPLFTGYMMFLFKSMARRCRYAYVPAIFLVLTQASSIGLWAKSTGFAMDIAIIIAYAGVNIGAAARPSARRPAPVVGRPVGAYRKRLTEWRPQ